MTSGRPAFQQHAEHAEGSDSALPPCTFRKYCTQSEKTATSPNCKQSSAAQRGRDASGQRRASCASLSRRLSAFFGSTPGQDPKAAKFAVLPPGHAGFPNRVKRSEGSDTTPIRNAPCFAVWAVVCDPSPKAECVPAFWNVNKRGPFVGEVKNRNKKRFETALWW